MLETQQSSKLTGNPNRKRSPDLQLTIKSEQLNAHEIFE